MGFFDFLFDGGKKTDNNGGAKPVMSPRSLGEPVSVAPGIQLPEIMARHWNEIRQTERIAVAITATPSGELPIRQSKFGSYPCQPTGFDYPTYKESNYLYPLAQINFSECRNIEGFPSFGYLQFYIATDDIYGIDFDDQQTQSGFRVLFFEEADVMSPIEDFSFLEAVVKSEYVPVPRPYSLASELKNECIGQSDYQGQHHPVYNLTMMTAKYLRWKTNYRTPITRRLTRPAINWADTLISLRKPPVSTIRNDRIICCFFSAIQTITSCGAMWA